MCEAASIASFGISAASSALGGISSGIQAKNSALQSYTNDLIGYWKAQMEARVRTKQYELNAENSRTAFEDNLAQIGLQEQQIQQSAAEARIAMERNARQAKATAITAAGESGVGGISIESILADMVAQRRNATGTMARQTEWDLEATNQMRKQAGIQMIDRTFSMAPGIDPIAPTYQKPSTGMNWVSSGLNILSSGLNSYTTAQSRIANGQGTRLW